MDIRAMERISDMLCAELDEIAAKGNISSGDLEVTYKAIGIIKDIGKIKMLEGQSHGDWGAMGSYAPTSGYSSRRYSRDGASYGNSYGNSYNGGKEMLLAEMRNVLNTGNLDPRERDCITKAMDMMR